MGEGFKRAQAAGFRGRTTKNLEAMKVVQLLQQMQPTCLERHFRFAAVDGGRADVGDQVLIFVDVDGEIKVSRTSTVVGCVDADDMQCLRDALEIGDSFLMGTVTRVSELDDGFDVRISEGEK